MNEPDYHFGAKDPEAIAAVERIVANWPIQLPDPRLDGPCCINSITGREIATYESHSIRRPEP